VVGVHEPIARRHTTGTSRETRFTFASPPKVKRRARGVNASSDGVPRPVEAVAVSFAGAILRPHAGYGVRGAAPNGDRSLVRTFVVVEELRGDSVRHLNVSRM
jgi:hypothetical protein